LIWERVGEGIEHISPDIFLKACTKQAEANFVDRVVGAGEGLDLADDTLVFVGDAGRCSSPDSGWP